MSKQTMSIDDMLERRHELFLEWNEPWEACGPEGNKLDAHVVLKATVHDCVNMSRLQSKAHGQPTMGNDDDFLCDFIAVHWAALIVPPISK